MTESVLSLVTKLRSAGEDEKHDLCVQLSERIESEPDAVSAHLRNALGLSANRIVRSMVGVETARDVKVFMYPYRDDDSRMKLSLAIVFVQDYRSAVEGADEMIASSIQDSIADRQLSCVVNDVSVNCQHLCSCVDVKGR